MEREPTNEGHSDSELIEFAIMEARETNTPISDSELIEFAIMEARETNTPISDAAARVIASQHHGGQSSELYSLTSTGNIGVGLLDEITSEFEAANLELENIKAQHSQLRADLLAHEMDLGSGLGLSISYESLQEMRRELADVSEAKRTAQATVDALGYLYVYAHRRPDKGPVDGWSQLWLKSPGELLWESENTDDVATLDEQDLCTHCGSHFSDPHAPGCALTPDVMEPEPKPSLEDQIKQKFAGVTTGRLIERMERASDETNLDDETYELNRRLRDKGQTWRWSQSFTKPQIIVVDLPEGK